MIHGWIAGELWGEFPAAAAAVDNPDRIVPGCGQNASGSPPRAGVEVEVSVPRFTLKESKVCSNKGVS